MSEFSFEVSVTYVKGHTQATRQLCLWYYQLPFKDFFNAHYFAPD